MFEDAISLLSIWASMNSWLTPTVLFLFLNLMIGTIAVTSGFSPQKPPPRHHHNHHDATQTQTQTQTQKMTRSPSLLQRLKSIDFYNYTYKSPPLQLHSPLPDPDPVILQNHNEPIPEPDPVTQIAIPDPPAEHDPVPEGPTMEEVYSRIIIQKSGPAGQNSDTKPAGGHFESAEMAAVEGGGGGDEEVDAKADDFINRFREQLKLQKMDSVVRY